MPFSALRIEQLCPRVDRAAALVLASALEVTAPQFDVNTVARRAAFMGQCAVESVGFTRLEENLGYSHADRIAAVWPRLASRAAELAGKPAGLANAAYAGKNGNGDEASGDGWRFRGRGLIQITGRANYARACAAAGVDLLADPDKAKDPAVAVRIALWFWQSHGCNELAEAGRVDAITRTINGSAMEQANVRQALTDRAKSIFV